jgi:hypothetical protein
MTEPIYNYVKGEGWVASHSHVVTMACGKVVTLEFRPPLGNEYYDHGTDSVLGTTAAPNVEAWKRSLANTDFRYLIRKDPDRVHRNTTDGCYVVVVPV